MVGAGPLPRRDFFLETDGFNRLQGSGPIGRKDEDRSSRSHLENAKAEVERWRGEADLAISEVASLERELEALRKRYREMRSRAQARSGRLSNEAINLAAQTAAEVTKVRVGMQEEMARCRLERQKLREELAKQHLAVTSHEREVQKLANSSADTLRFAVQRAANILRASSSPLQGTIDWLVAVEKAVQTVPETGMEAEKDSGGCHDSSKACEVVHGSAALMVEQWLNLARSAAEASKEVTREEELIKELHATRGRSASLMAELGSRQREVAELQECLDLEHFRAETALNEQRWLVPRVAAVVKGLEERFEALPAPPPGCENGWPWELPLDELVVPSEKSRHYSTNAGTQREARFGR
eukprot:TRINITY_DN9988_c1_g1_i5.p1 TRINITY_DN9988_c1_g1~~TRINITY_DN9988_c1_g1_i5.p1  ORF type:complete len:357 (+),score=79.74 TRINITY_DN9988_c1_g1_i5:367-1437(+)